MKGGNGTPENFMRIGNSLLTLFIAWFGGTAFQIPLHEEPIWDFGTGSITSPDRRLTAIKELLAACEATPESHSPGWARLFLRWGGRGFHFDRFFAFRHTDRHDANSASWLGTDTDRPAQNLLPDEFLDIRQVGVGFEFTPAGLVCSVNHRFVPSTGKWQRHRSTEFARHSSRAITPDEHTQGIQQLGKHENQRILEMSAKAFIKPNDCLFMLRKRSQRSRGMNGLVSCGFNPSDHAAGSPAHPVDPTGRWHPTGDGGKPGR